MARSERNIGINNVKFPNKWSEQESEKVEFLEAAAQSGFEAFQFGVNDYGARSNQREGCILERGRRRWEIRLAKGQQRRLSAYVEDFRIAGRAVQAWLDGSCAQEIVSNLREHMVVPPSAKAGYKLSDGQCSE